MFPSSVENLEEAVNLYQQAMTEGLQEDTPEYANALMHMGNAKILQAKLNINPETNTQTAEKLYLQARNIFTKSTQAWSTALSAL